MKTRRFLSLDIVVAMALALSISAFAQVGYKPSKENLAARAVFEQSRFGIFIHWGLYAMVGHGEWVMQNENIDYEEYSRLAGAFYPSKFNAMQWARIFKASGAKYVTITSRHHDGFSMWDTDASSYNVVDATPFQRDVIGELAQACQENDLRLHFYYSHLDWWRLDYWPRGRTNEKTRRPDGKEGDWERYLEFIDQQLTELLTRYGPVGAIWFDGIWDKDARPRDEQPVIWNLYHQYALIHQLQPACLVGNNHHLLPFDGEDIQIFEQDIPGYNERGFAGQEISKLPLETCRTTNEHWGYSLTDQSFKSSTELIQYLARTAAQGANLLLNIGPRPDGSLPDKVVESLLGVGRWLDKNGESIYGTKRGCVPPREWGVTTQNGNTLYVHVLKNATEVALPVKENVLLAAKLLDGGAEVKFKKTTEGVVLSIPEQKWDEVSDLVLELSFKKNL